jgi:hypothetical protein
LNGLISCYAGSLVCLERLLHRLRTEKAGDREPPLSWHAPRSCPPGERFRLTCILVMSCQLRPRSRVPAHGPSNWVVPVSAVSRGDLTGDRTGTSRSHSRTIPMTLALSLCAEPLHRRDYSLCTSPAGSVDRRRCKLVPPFLDAISAIISAMIRCS